MKNAFAFLPLSTLVLSATLTGALPVYVQAQASGPVAQYTFDDGTGRDVTGNGHDAQGFNTTARSGCMDFNGYTSYMVAPDAAGLPSANSPRTISYWYNYSGTLPDMSLSLGLNPVTSNQHFVVGTLSDGATNYLFTDGLHGENNLALNTAPPAPNTWNLFTFTYDGLGNWKYFLNGVFKQSGTFPVGINTVTDGIEIGRYAGLNFQGTLDDVRIYNRVMNSSEIAAIAANPPSCSAATMCPGSLPGYEYSLGVVANLYVDDLGGQGYRSSGGPVGCSGVAGWELVSQSCMFGGAGSSCWSIGCLYRRPSSVPRLYVMTHWGNNSAGNNTGQNCSQYSHTTPHDSNVSVPPPGYTLKNFSCVVRDGRGVCESDLCFWEKTGVTATTDLVFNGWGGPIYSHSQNCAAAANPGNGFSLKNNNCTLSLGGACSNWICLWEKSEAIAQCSATAQCSDGVDNDGDGATDSADFSCANGSDNDETNTKAQCQDGVDNDNDGKTDYPQDPGCSSKQDNDEVNAAAPQCSDGIDNDSDGATDFPNDFSCSSATDTDETNIKAACQDGIDNDSDGLTDFPQDSGCSSKQDNDEFNTVAPQCSDGVDNADPEDTFADYNDIGCYTNGVYNPQDNDETNVASTAQCQDGIDNDGDGATDYPADFSCSSATDTDETNTKAGCQDGIDNDNDGLTDFPQDPGCSSKQDSDEGSVVVTLPKCSDGIDNDGDGRTDFFDAGCYPNNIFNPVAYNPNDNDESNAAVLCRWARVSNQWVRQCQ